MIKKFLTRLSILLVAFFSLFTQASAQSNQHGLLAAQNGVIEHITRIPQNQQYVFDVTQPKNKLGLPNNADLLLLNSETDQLGQTHYRFQETMNGFPIENSMLIVSVSNGKAITLIGNIALEFPSAMNQNLTATLSRQDAIALAMHKVNATQYAWQSAQMEQNYKTQMGDATATFYPKAELCWYNFGENIDPSNLRLSYKVDIYALQPLGRSFYYVDAVSGKILGKKDILCNIDVTGTASTAYSGVQTIHSDNTSGTNFRLRDLTKGNGVITLTSAGADYTNTSANWSLAGVNQYALDAHYGVSQTYAFYLANFNRNSVNNSGYALTSYVNESTTTDNAYWDGTSMHFGNRSSNGAGITAIDVDGHELTHGVTQYTSNLTYSGQSGAMNESMSDIFGKSVQFWSKPTDVNWALSNDMGWFIRDMANPNSYGQPDTYLGTNWYTGTADNGGVHTNSGVGNFMFYLLVTGGSGTNDIGNTYSVTGIGLTAADAILYRTETVYLVPSSNYTNWRNACISAATDLYGASSTQVSQVMNAWYAVGIGAAAPSGTCGAPASLASASITDNSAVLSWGAVSGASSYVVQYKTTSAANWTSVAIAGTSATITGLVSGTLYTFQVQSVCTSGGSSAFSAVSTFTTTGVAPVVYCTSNGQSFDGITNVTFNTINNTTSGITTGYNDYTTTQSTTVSTGSTYTLSAKINTGGNYTNYTKAWIDWNHDGTFSTSEEFNLGSAVNVTNGQTSLSPSVTVPGTAFIGSTRMRASTQYGVAPSPCTASFDGEVEDYTIVISAASSCATPTGLTSTAISTTGATVSWTSTGASSYDLNWKLSTSNTWTTVAGITATSYVLSGLVSCSQYNFQVIANCGTTPSVASASAGFVTTGCTVTYCTSYGTNQSREYIKKVSLGTIVNTTGSNAGYGDYTALSTNLIGGTSNTMNLTPGFVTTSRRQYWNVWIDYNHNGVFTDAGERVLQGNGTSTIAKNFTVPTSALNGPTRMRVQMQYNSYVSTSCTVFTNGEVEDYSVNITGNVLFNSAETVETIEPKTQIQDVHIYPNPATNAVNAQIGSSSDCVVMINLYNLVGQKITGFNMALVQGNNNKTIDTSEFENGIYILEIEGDGIHSRNKFMIEK